MGDPRLRRGTSGLAAAVLVGIALLALAGRAAGEPIDRDRLPAALRGWVDWVLFEHDDAGCSFLDARSERWCAWPGPLELDLDGRGGRFEQGWELEREQWIALPGDATHWPEQVRVDGRRAAVAPQPAAEKERAGRPRVRLPAGSHRVTGRFSWNELPPLLAVPSETGIVRLKIRGRAVARPERDPRGRLWLARPAPERAPEGRLEIDVWRRLIDEVPLQVESQVELRVAGPEREVLLGRALPRAFVPMAVEGALPARFESEGRLRVQLRPGTHRIRLLARHPGPAASVELAEPGGPWASEEVWAFDARPQLRVVNVEGAVAIDPQQTRLPNAWRRLPAYRLRPGEMLRLVERRRGDPDPSERLALERTLWLDFGGGGLTFHDRITGRLRHGVRLELRPPGELGRASVNGQDWFLTRLEDGAPVGVEVPAGPVTVEADGRLEGVGGRLPVAGWGRGFERVGARLALPPGWRLFYARGVDAVSRDWVGTWTMLDFFLVLVAAAAASRLWGRRASVLALVALALTWTEAGAPRGVWLAALGAEALVQLLGTGRLLPWVRAVRLLAWVGLALVAVPFLIGQMQEGLYPALRPPSRLELAQEQARREGRAATDALAKLKALGRAAPESLVAEAMRERAGAPAPTELFEEEPAPPPRRPAPDLRSLDPDALIPTGPGLPRWSWRSVALGWSGPVAAGQELHLILLPPALTRLLAFARVALVAALFAVAIRRGRQRGPSDPPRGAGSVAALLAGLLLVSGVAPPASAEIPTPELLEELRRRLLEPPACRPRCASIPRLALDLRDGELRLRAELHAAAQTAVPLPGPPQWQPTSVRVDGEPARALRRDEAGSLWLPLAPGVHELALVGPVAPETAVIEIPLPLAPRRVAAVTPGWEVLGLDAEGRASGALRLRRLESERAEPQARLEVAPLPPFVRVERTLRLGVDWSVATRAVRLTPPGDALVLEVPLLPGEAVTTAGIGVEEGKARVPLAPGVAERTWSSTLEPRPRLELLAPDAVPWVEVWRLEATPLWHVEAEGIPPIGIAENHPSPPREWRPWPGESLALAVRRPAGVGGGTLTIDASQLELRPGRRASEATLALELRSSQGGLHPILLPEGAELRTVRIDGRAQPIRAEGREVILPLAPGVRRAELVWESAEGIGSRLVTPRLELGAPTVNLETRVAVPSDRWLLFLGGPPLGPAVLFWSVLAVVAVLAVGLARLRVVPLRAASWFLLGIGLTQAPLWTAAIVVGWLLALGARREQSITRLDPLAFDGVQLLLVLWTLAAFAGLFEAVRHGLLGPPEMQVAGNGSTASLLRWGQDRAADGIARPAWVISVPILVYRVAMLAWALWLARALLGWLRWGWECFTAGGLRHPLRRAASTRERPGSR